MSAPQMPTRRTMRYLGVRMDRDEALYMMWHHALAGDYTEAMKWQFAFLCNTDALNELGEFRTEADMMSEIMMWARAHGTQQ